MSTWSELKNTPRLKNIYDTRVEIIKSIREFFWSQGFLETDTPVAVRLASQEPYLNPVSITISDPNGKSEKFYLRTSPEYALKKLLAVGYEKVFEIGKCFRDFESFGGNHNPEFTMLGGTGRLEYTKK
jgi:lysyl-tRNA synthetase class 2